MDAPHQFRARNTPPYYVAAVFALLLFSVNACFSKESPGELTYEQWKEACSRLPSNRSLQGRMPAKQLLPLPSSSDFERPIVAFLELCTTNSLAQATNWVGEAPKAEFFNTNSGYFLKGAGKAHPFQPFAQKLSIPPESEVFLRGDLHGDVHSLLANLSWLNEKGYLSGFTIQRPNFYMIFLGDYTDRGSYGIEVLYTLFRLKVANPDGVYLSRGNHEEVSLQSRYGFLAEARAKYGREFNPFVVLRAYDFLPVVTYLGSGGNFIQCNHGGMEPGFSPRNLVSAEGPARFQLIGLLQQKTFLKQHPEWLAQADSASRDLARQAMQDFRPEDPIGPSVLGFMWNDFSVLSSEPQFAVDPGRAFVYGKDATQFLLQSASSESAKVQAVFRGHQQSSVLNPMMRRLVAGRGAFRHWQTNDSPVLLNAAIPDLSRQLESKGERPIPSGSVWTFNVSPDSVYGEGCNYDFDAFGILKVAPEFSDWRLKIINVPVRR